MKLGIIGSGGREHALCEALSKSKKVDKIYCFPGNAGTSKIAENILINTDDFNALKKFILSENIQLIIVGPEKPLVEGIVDFFESINIPIFGPNKFASQLEGSKIFTKKICEKYKIPTAKFGIFENIDKAKSFIGETKFPLVVKADGLAAGKGVYICENKDNASNAIEEIFNGKFGKAKHILIEEFLKGEEMSYFIVSDGKNIKRFQTAQDHKRVGEGDTGKNTGGMGAYSPSRLINKELDEKILEKIIQPTLKALKDMNCIYKGFLYAGLMITNNEPYLIEYNVRMGDPECQTIIPKLKSDLLDIILACIESKLDQIQIDWHDINSLCIVLCSKGYPDQYKKDMIIKNLTKINLDQNQKIYHAGTKIKNEDIVSNGGRVLNFVNLSRTFKKARESNIKLIEEINWPNGFYRKDIGFNVIE
jgi:phosphoribosylamine--glycine ligase|tara:strand:+ start:42 stop:1304 length:1263 start_codon:yes stop_codon:yes gene_type:complete